MVINMNTEKVADGEEESYLEIKKFWNEIERQKAKQIKKGMKELDWESIIKWAIIKHMAPTVFSFVTLAVIAETAAIFYSYFIGNMIEYINGKEDDVKTGVLYVAIFGSAQFFSLLLR